MKNPTSGGMPRHIAVIMDGNGRWAAARALPRSAGHGMGVRTVKQIVEACLERRIEALTLFAFSSENWQRPREEVSMLMNRFLEALDDEIEGLHNNGVRLRFIGNLSQLSAALRERMESAMQLTANNQGMALVIAIAYGGRWDIANATRELARRCAAGELQSEAIDEAAVHAHLALAGLPDPDLLIRTGGEQRISNFLLWNLAYTELYFCDTLWPDFGARELDAAIEHFSRRQRRFGLTPGQAGAR
ncbi:polyprenyl diphosphate synthase [Steroidobacter cummioxidans]|uniref:polyprenyl diphosphate synthase n=1 Tax=Steroidobacter cummioxidans TaxID=1803913 RepID=UPI001F4D7D22|nr:polyprenyl diphosphate synthase [Steroidobacter cummioxidans]